MIDNSVVEMFFKEEFKKIPSIFKFTRKKLLIIGIVSSVIVFGLLILAMLIPDSYELVVVESLGGQYESEPLAVYNNLLLTLVIIGAAILAFLAAWILIAKTYEKKAYAKASRLAAQYQEHEYKKTMSEYNDIMHNRIKSGDFDF